MWQGKARFRLVALAIALALWGLGPGLARPAQAATIGLHWNGTETVWWAIYPVGGNTRVGYSGIGPGETKTKDVAPGVYEVQVEAPGFTRVRVEAGTMLTPPVGQIALHWTGVAGVWWTVYLSGGKNRIASRPVAPGGTSSRDIAPGTYDVDVEAPGYRRAPAAVRDRMQTTLRPLVGQIALQWLGAKRVWWSLYEAGGRDRINCRAVGPGQTSTWDIAPGSYELHIDEPDRERVPVAIQAGRMTVLRMR